MARRSRDIDFTRNQGEMLQNAGAVEEGGEGVFLQDADLGIREKRVRLNFKVLSGCDRTCGSGPCVTSARSHPSSSRVRAREGEARHDAGRRPGRRPVDRKRPASSDGDAENVFLMDDDLGIGDEPVRLNLEVPISVRRDMKGWSSWHDRTMTSVILEGFDLMKQRYGA